MRYELVTILLVASMGCAARVPVRVPAAPSVQVPTRAISIVAVDRDCRGIGDELAEQLRSIDGMSVKPNAPTRLNIFACSTAFVMNDEDVVEGRTVAIAALSTVDGVVAHLLGAAQRLEHTAESAGTVKLPKRVQSNLDAEVARDLAEQVAPVSTVVHRRVYENPSDNSARQFHNLAVAAEREGRLDDAVWWARLSWERRPTARRARYVSELTRRISRTRPAATDKLTSR